MKIKFNWKFFIIFLLILFIEIIIGLYIRDLIIRPYGGDVLVILLIYYFVKSFIVTKPTYIIIGVLLFAYIVEFGQYFKMIEILQLQNNKLMSIILGTSFSWIDMLCYTLGASICYIIETPINKNSSDKMKK